MTLLDAIKHPNATPVFLISISAGVWLRAWVSDGTIRRKVPFTDAPSSVVWNNSTTLTQVASASDVESAAGRWHHDGAFLYVSTPGGASVWGGVIQAIVTLYVSNHPKQLNNRYYEPRIKSVPNISQRIEAQFGGLGQIGGGTVILHNADKFFDSRSHWQWNARFMSVMMGVDLPGNIATFAEYSTVSTWAIEEWTITPTEFQLKIREPKDRVRSPVISETYTREAYPNIEQSDIGKPIPIAYGKLLGISPVRIDPGLRKYKVAGHAITSIDGISYKVSVERAGVDTPTAWQAFSTNTVRVYYPGREVKKVVNNSTVLTSKESADDVVATSNSWAYEDGWLYIRVATVGVVTVNYSQQIVSWLPATISSQDNSLAEFTVGQDVPFDSELAVDFTGKQNIFGEPMVSAASVIEDILSQVGETLIDGIDDSNTALQIATDENGSPVYKRALSLYINDRRTAQEIIASINAFCGTFVYSNETGAFFVGVSRPKTRANIFDISESELYEWSEVESVSKLVTKVEGKYAVDVARGEFQITSYSRIEQQRINNQPEPVVKLVDLPFFAERDAVEYAQRITLMQSVPLRRFRLKVGWIGWGYEVGDHVTVKISSRSVFQKFEVIERNVELNSMTVTFILGDLRGLGDSPGWWVDDASTLPAQFSALAGYGTGSLTWNKNWHPDIKRWARNNVGYWTDANGFADSTDPDSAILSTWT